MKRKNISDGSKIKLCDFCGILVNNGLYDKL